LSTVWQKDKWLLPVQPSGRSINVSRTEQFEYAATKPNGTNKISKVSPVRTNAQRTTRELTAPHCLIPFDGSSIAANVW
jgi:hypothetical protein